MIEFEVDGKSFKMLENVPNLLDMKADLEVSRYLGDSELEIEKKREAYLDVVRKRIMDERFQGRTIDILDEEEQKQFEESFRADSSVERGLAARLWHNLAILKFTFLFKDLCVEPPPVDITKADKRTVESIFFRYNEEVEKVTKKKE